MTATARRLILDKRPKPGLVAHDLFHIEEGGVPAPGAGEFRVKVEVISLDPAMRGWINEGKSYVAPVPLGGTMRAYAAGHVEASNNSNFKVGDAVQGLFGAQTHAISNGDRVVKVDTLIAPLERWVGGLGMPGWTAYFGLLEVGQPKPGETVVVSAASGAVGSIVGQIAKIKGCRAVGIAGGPEKCRYVVQELGFDACVDYKSGHLAASLKAACPNGIDVNFENVGGDILDTVLLQMNTFGRIAVCGLISAYTATSMPEQWRFSASPVAPQIIVQAAAPTSTPKAAAPKPRVTRVAAVEDYVPYEAPRRSRQPLQSAGNAPRSGDPYEPNPYGNAAGGAYGGPQEGGNGVYGGGYRNAPVQVTQAAPVQAPAPRPICGNCGVIEAITENTVAGAGTGIGGIGGALGGAVIGKQFGKGRGSDALAILGAIGGAVAGHQVEKSVRSTKVYEVRVKMEDGSTRSMTQASPPAWRNGDRVRVDGNSISVI